MRLRSVELLPATIPLSRPYAVATYACDAVRMVRVQLVTDDGQRGLGAASPEPEVTGETFEQCLAALQSAVEWLPGQTFSAPHELATFLRTQMPATPGARAAIDMALHDLWGKAHGLPVVELLGRVHHALPTSITIGVLDVAATLAEAREYLARGFRVLKVKIGNNLDLDVERLVRLREELGAALPLLVDANVGYTLPQLVTFLERTRALDLQLVEQPLLPADSAALATLPSHDINRLVADESLHDRGDAAKLVQAPRAFGAFNIKLMKCGGLTEARAIASIAEEGGLGLMWGCMDESVIGIAAALHTAFACRATRWLDLDGSFDLGRDFANGGFGLVEGVMRVLERPGLGVVARD